MSDARSSRGSRFAGDLQRAANECESPGTEATLVPLLRRPSILVCFDTFRTLLVRVPLRATPLLCSEYTHTHGPPLAALPIFLATFMPLKTYCRRKSCKPILVLRRRSIQFRAHVRERDNESSECARYDGTAMISGRWRKYYCEERITG